MFGARTSRETIITGATPQINFNLRDASEYAQVSSQDTLPARRNDQRCRTADSYVPGGQPDAQPEPIIFSRTEWTNYPIVRRFILAGDFEQQTSNVGVAHSVLTLPQVQRLNVTSDSLRQPGYLTILWNLNSNLHTMDAHMLQIEDGEGDEEKRVALHDDLCILPGSMDLLIVLLEHQDALHFHAGLPDTTGMSDSFTNILAYRANLTDAVRPLFAAARELLQRRLLNQRQKAAKQAIIEQMQVILATESVNRGLSGNYPKLDIITQHAILDSSLNDLTITHVDDLQRLFAPEPLHLVESPAINPFFSFYLQGLSEQASMMSLSDETMRDVQIHPTSLELLHLAVNLFAKLKLPMPEITPSKHSGLAGKYEQASLQAQAVIDTILERVRHRGFINNESLLAAAREVCRQVIHKDTPQPDNMQLLVEAFHALRSDICIEESSLYEIEHPELFAGKPTQMTNREWVDMIKKSIST